MMRLHSLSAFRLRRTSYSSPSWMIRHALHGLSKILAQIWQVLRLAARCDIEHDPDERWPHHDLGAFRRDDDGIDTAALSELKRLRRFAVIGRSKVGRCDHGHSRHAQQTNQKYG